MSEQTAIEPEGEPMPAEPHEMTCDICGEKAAKRYEFMRKIPNTKGLVGRAMFAFACDAHDEMVYLTTLPDSERKRIEREKQARFDAQ